MAYFGVSLTGVASEWFIDQEISHWHIWGDMAHDFVRQFQYNVDIMPDRNTLSNTRKKPSESFREYAIKWREQAARVKPPLNEQELVDIFIEAQDPDYFHHLTAAMGRLFHTAIKIGEMVESGLKTGRIVSQAAIKATTHAIQGGSTSFENLSPSPYTVLNAQSYVHPPNHPHFRAPSQGKFLPQRPPYQVPYNSPLMQNYAQDQAQKKKFTPLGESYSSLFQKLRKIGAIECIPPHRLNPNAPGFQANEICEYHSGAPGHSTDNCRTLKGAIEKLIEHGVVVVTDDQNTPNVTNNPLPAENNLVGMVCDDQEYKLLSKMGKLFRKIGEEDKSMKSLEPIASLSVEGVNLETKFLCFPGVSKGIEVRAAMPKLYVSKGFSLTQHDQSCLTKLKEPIFVKPVQQLPVIDSKSVPWNYNKTAVVYRGKEIVEEVDEAGALTLSGRCYSPEELRKAKMTENIQVPLKKAVTEEENKTPAQISLLSLLLHSEEHRLVLNKVLNEAHMPKETKVNQLENMTKRVFESNAITFTNDELPKKGAGHNKALHLTVTCQGYYVKRVMIDGGSGVDICPLSTLQSLKVNTDIICPSNVFVRAYDGSRRDTIGEIKLNMTIGPVVFTIVFQVMDMETSYNFLLGRPWIHMARAIPSTLHQVVKFEYNNKEITVHREDDSPIYRDPSVPYIEAKEGCDSVVYQSFEVVSVDRFKEGESIIQSCIFSSASMVATMMLKYGYQPGKGLGVYSQGIVDPITLLGNQGTSGLGYKQSKRNVDKANNHKRIDWSLPQPIPHISHSFIKPQGPELKDSFTLEYIEEVIKDLSHLFCEVDMVQVGEGTSHANMQLVGSGVELRNWEATPFPIRKESCSVNAGFDNMTCMRNSLPDFKELFILESPSQKVEYDDKEAFMEINRELEQFEHKPKPNLSETETINLGSSDDVKEIKISLHINQEIREAIIQLLFEYKDVFAWSYDDMSGLSVDLVVHKLPVYPDFPPVQQKRRKFKPDVSEKIKEEIMKQLNAKVIQVIRYTTWLENVVPVPKKDGKTRVCVDYRDLNKASPKDSFPLPNIHFLVDNCGKHEMQSFVDCYAGYHQILMDEEDAEKTAFTTPWGTYCYRVMPFGLKNAGATYMRAMTTMFHDMMLNEIEVYVDDVIIKSKTQVDHVQDLRKFLERVRIYDLKINPAKCAFKVPFGKLLGFIVSKRGIELDPSKIKAIRDLPSPKNKTEVMSLLGMLNYISRFIAQLTTTCEPIFKHLKKVAAVRWTEYCQRAFEKIKEYLSNPPVLVPPEPDRPLFLYLSVTDNSFGCILGQHDATGRKEQAIYYLSKKFTSYEVKYTLLERTCCALTWVAQKLRHYLLSYTTYLISRMDPLKYIFQKPMPTGRLAKWQILLTKFDIIYVTRIAMKVQALADHLAENPVDGDYEPLDTYFPDEEINTIEEVVSNGNQAWQLYFDGATNTKGTGIGAILISPTGQHYPATARLRFFCKNNTTEYEACIMGLNVAIDLGVQELIVLGDSDLLIRQAQGEWKTRDLKLLPYRQCVEDLSKRFMYIEFRYIPRFHNDLADALATLASMLPYLGNTYITPLEIQVRDQHVYCNTVEAEPDGEPWYSDIKNFLKTGRCPEHANRSQKRTIRRLAVGFFFSGDVLYKRTPDLNLLRCLDAEEAEKIMNEVHAGVCGPHMNGYVLAKKIPQAGYYLLTMERDCFHFVKKCHQCQIHGDLIHSPHSELHPMAAPWPFVAWGMDVIGPIEPKASNGHRFILVAIDYFTKWVEAITFKAVTKKAVVDFFIQTLFVDLVSQELSSQIMLETSIVI
ncbi:uncharacterized protein LOC114076473 [Solanum pennellii]|uniref:Uncharacterized protein LOC114076473 n=1 Tax=Solanum pennellii TaxID=28526 RepID=A0ABM1V6K6_SOLPN|nr:uncharacterized protein LOC114076473 [Solanum pennellii]